MDDEDGFERLYTSRRERAFQSVADYRKTFEYHEKHLKIAREMGDQGGEEGAYGNLGNAYQSLQFGVK